MVPKITERQYVNRHFQNAIWSSGEDNNTEHKDGRSCCQASGHEITTLDQLWAREKIHIIHATLHEQVEKHNSQKEILSSINFFKA